MNRFSLILLIAILCSPACDKNEPTRKRAESEGVTMGSESFSSDFLRLKTLSEVHNDLHVGCEALDRGYGDYDAYKAYLIPLGMRHIRLQAGWAKTEKEPGVYDFTWLDRIIDDAVSRGIEPWLQVSYGNPIYSGGGGAYSSGGWPTSGTALNAWDAWVRALAERYRGKVHEWEIWNEPDLLISRGKGTMAELIDLSLRTAAILRETDPDASVAALALAKLDTDFLNEFLTGVQAAGKLDLFDWISYHHYTYRPEDTYSDVEQARIVLSHYSGHLQLWHGEAGAPSAGWGDGALSAYDWSETSQAKWGLRNILNDRAHGVRTGIYTLAENNYAAGRSTKGLLETNDLNQVLRAKEAFYAMRNLVSVYDLLDAALDASGIKIGTLESVRKLLFQDTQTELKSIVLWADGATPTDTVETTPVAITVAGFVFDEPLCVDLRTGRLFRLESYVGNGIQTLYNVPLYDSPTLIAEARLLMQ